MAYSDDECMVVANNIRERVKCFKDAVDGSYSEESLKAIAYHMCGFLEGLSIGLESRCGSKKQDMITYMDCKREMSHEQD